VTTIQEASRQSSKTYGLSLRVEILDDQNGTQNQHQQGNDESPLICGGLWAFAGSTNRHKQCRYQTDHSEKQHVSRFHNSSFVRTSLVFRGLGLLMAADCLLAEQNYPSLQAHAGWTERHLSKCALPMPSQIAARGTVLRLYPCLRACPPMCLRACPPIEFFIVARPTERF